MRRPTLPQRHVTTRPAVPCVAAPPPCPTTAKCNGTGRGAAAAHSSQQARRRGDDVACTAVAAAVSAVLRPQQAIAAEIAVSLGPLAAAGLKLVQVQRQHSGLPVEAAAGGQQQRATQRGRHERSRLQAQQQRGLVLRGPPAGAGCRHSRKLREAHPKLHSTQDPAAAAAAPACKGHPAVQALQTQHSQGAGAEIGVDACVQRATRCAAQQCRPLSGLPGFLVRRDAAPGASAAHPVAAPSQRPAAPPAARCRCWRPWRESSGATPRLSGSAGAGAGWQRSLAPQLAACYARLMPSGRERWRRMQRTTLCTAHLCGQGLQRAAGQS